MTEQRDLVNMICTKCGEKITGMGSLQSKIVDGKLIHIVCPVTEQKDKCPECGGTGDKPETTMWPKMPDDCPICNGTGEKKLDSPREKIEEPTFLPPDYISWHEHYNLIEEARNNSFNSGYREAMTFDSDKIEEAKKQERERIVEELQALPSENSQRFAIAVAEWINKQALGEK